jgi:acyl-coenzyme A synthetase/AMP-(fatty) acid ligase
MFDRPIRDFAQWTPRAPAVVTPTRTVGYAAFNADIDRIGAALFDLGVRPEVGVVSLEINDVYLHRAILCALARLGVVSSPQGDDVADLKLVVPPIGQAGRAGPGRLILTRDWAADVLAHPHHPLPILNSDPDRVVRVMLSSGTTAKPKRVATTWRRAEAITLANFSVYGGVGRQVWVPLTGSDSLMGHAMGPCAWALGAAAGAGWSGALLPGLMEQYRSGVVVITSESLRHMLRDLPARFEPRPGWRFQVGGAALPAGLAEEARLRLTSDLWTGYGATESSRITAGPAAAQADTPGAVGWVVAGAQVEIVDPEGRALPDGESGELRVRGVRTADGYIDDPEATEAAFRGGWYCTRDLAMRLPDGRIVIEGRLDDRMIVSGRKLMPAQIERPASGHPGVFDCAAFAAPDAAGLDQPWLAVVVAEGFDRQRVAGEIITRAELPMLRIAWVEEVPRNQMGKVERAALREALLRALAGRPGG